MSERPLPVPDAATAPYWDAAREHRLVMPKCADCGAFHFYPRTLCPSCSSSRIEWTACSGRAEVYSYTIVHRAPGPAFVAEVRAIRGSLTAGGVRFFSRIGGTGAFSESVMAEGPAGVFQAALAPLACGATIDSIGVYVQARHTYISGILGSTRDVDGHTVMRLEPLPADQCS
jgi:hypothetical protein